MVGEGKNRSARLLDWRYGLVADHVEAGQRVLDFGAQRPSSGSMWNA